MHTKILLSILIIFIGLFSCGAIFFVEDGRVNMGTMGTFGSQLDDGYWTFSFWFKISATSQGSLFGCRSAGKGEFNIMVNTKSDLTAATGNVMAMIYDADGQRLRGGVNADLGYSDGLWHNVTIQISCPADTIRIYYDGVKQTVTYGRQEDVDRVLDFNDDFWLGAYNNDGSWLYGFDGYISEVAFFKAELSAQCLQSLGARKRCAFQVGSPVYYWRLNEYTEGRDLDDVVIKDFTGNNNGVGVDPDLGEIPTVLDITGYSDPIPY